MFRQVLIGILLISAPAMGAMRQYAAPVEASDWMLKDLLTPCRAMVMRYFQVWLPNS